MSFGLLLIALGFGYKIYVEASLNSKKRLKKLGRLVGGSMMGLSTIVAAGMLLCALACAGRGSGYFCPIKGGMMKSGKLFCPVTGKAVSQPPASSTAN
jgi:hypothetical protein